MNMRDFLDKNSNARIAEVASLCGTKVSYMRLIGCGAKRPSAVLARKFHDATDGEICKEIIRPDVFGSRETAA